MAIDKASAPSIERVGLGSIFQRFLDIVIGSPLERRQRRRRKMNAAAAICPESNTHLRTHSLDQWPNG